GRRRVARRRRGRRDSASGRCSRADAAHRAGRGAGRGASSASVFRRRCGVICARGLRCARRAGAAAETATVTADGGGAATARATTSDARRCAGLSRLPRR
ncbi:MAG: hypothetical protein MPL62_09595, partial [Alphaproteobacteria bacterium]|nr:hypothetical protein [Alphaproteobacteria bacterium]